MNFWKPLKFEFFKTVKIWISENRLIYFIETHVHRLLFLPQILYFSLSLSFMFFFVVKLPIVSTNNKRFRFMTFWAVWTFLFLFFCLCAFAMFIFLFIAFTKHCRQFLLRPQKNIFFVLLPHKIYWKASGIDFFLFCLFWMSVDMKKKKINR